MYKTFILLGAVGLSFLAQANLLQNGDFSSLTTPTRPTNWFVEDTTKARVEQSTDPVRFPAYSVRLTRLVSGTGNNAGVNQYVPVSPNLDYTISAWYYDDDVNASGGCGISWYTADTTFISSSDNSYTDSAVHTWQRVSKTSTSPATAGLAKVTLRIYGFTGSPPGGIVYLDDAEFVQGSGIAEDLTRARRPAISVVAQPNPAAGWTRLTVELPSPASVRLDVYDMTGVLVSTAFAGSLGAGRHSVPWSGTDQAGRPLSDGLYFAVLGDENGAISVSKLVLER